MKLTTYTIMLVLALAVTVSAQVKPTASSTASTVSDATVIPANSKVFVDKMEDGFDNYLVAALRDKKVPLLVVTNKDQADFEITGTSSTKKAGTAKIIFGSGRSEETASIQVINLKTSVVAFADSSHRTDAARGKRSTAEKLAKYLGEKIKSGK